MEHPAFSSDGAPGTETSCVYYSFYLPGSHSEIVLQVNYWLDVPASASAAASWRRAWSAASAEHLRAGVGIGDGSFQVGSQLSFKKGDIYITLVATETDWNLGTSSDRNKQLSLEGTIAAGMITHLQ